MATNKCRRLEFELVANSTAAFTGSDLYNDGYRGIKVFIVVNSVSGGNVTVTLEEKAPVADVDVYNTILASSSLTTTGLTVLEVYPGVTEVANLSESTTLPPTWRITTAAGATIDYSISYAYIP